MSLNRSFWQVALAGSLLASCVTTPSSSTTSDDPVSPTDADGRASVCDQTKDKHCFAHVRTFQGHKHAFAAPAGWGATDLIAAYKVNVNATSTATVAIVDAYGYSTLESDLAAYRTQFGLPACTIANGCLKIVNENGDDNSDASDPGDPPSSDDWTTETALDTQMVSSGCPHCKILVVQTTDENSLDNGVVEAASLGATVISNSWGGAESTSSKSEETSFNHPGIGVFVASGDSGFNLGGQGPDYPSTSEYVVAVGGTTLTTASSSRGYSEVAWTDGGSSCSKNFALPSFQTKTGKCSKRLASDVAAAGDGPAGIAVYDTDPSAQSSGWTQVDGTSAATPLVAAIFAATGNGAAANSFSYSNTSAFFDVTSGTNGSCGSDAECNAGVGWDGPTGNGTPNFAALALIGGQGSGSGSGSGSDSGSGSAGSGSDEGSGSDQGSNEGSGGGGDQGSGSGSDGNGDGSNGDNNGGNGSSGGGGCATSGSSSAFAIVFALGLAFARRRRTA